MSQDLPTPPVPLWLASAEPLLTAEQYRWLFDQGSLTRHLTHLSDHHFSVQPLLQAWQVLRDDECCALALPLGSSGWVREVLLCGHGQPWVFARSVAGRTALRQAGLDMAELGSRSLGELLFCDPAFTRQPIETCRYPARWLPASCAREGLWARRSRFDRDHLGILVAEVFLPDLWHAALPPSENC